MSNETAKRDDGGAAQQPAGRLIPFRVDEGPHYNDGLLLQGRDGADVVTAFIGRHVLDRWVTPIGPYGGSKSLFREEYNALGKRNLPAIQRIATAKYRRGPAFNRRHPFVDILLADITESGESLDASRPAQTSAAVQISAPHA